jgi:N4-gp56 family major capsid protein
MSKTTFTTNNPLTKKLWEEVLFRDIQIESFFVSKFMSEDATNLVWVKTNLLKSQGDQITFGIVPNLTGDGVTSGQLLEGNEEALGSFDYSVTLEQYRHGTRSRGKLDVQRAMFSIPEVSRAKLKIWGAAKIDKLLVAALLASPTKILYRDGVAGAPSGTSSAATAKAALTAANSKLTPNFISAIKTWAETGGGGQTWRIDPVMVDGVANYILLVPNACLYDLRIDSTFQTAQKDAMERGKTNPLFRNAVAVWDNVIIYQTERMPLFSDGGGAAVVGGFGALMGAQALVWAWGEKPNTIQDTFDYENETGWAWEMMAKPGKPVFDGKDYGSVAVCLAATDVTGI